MLLEIYEMEANPFSIENILKKDTQAPRSPPASSEEEEPKANAALSLAQNLQVRSTSELILTKTDQTNRRHLNKSVMISH